MSCFHVLQADIRIRNRHPRIFSSTTLFYRALRAISTNHFQAPVRRFIVDLFDVEINPHTLMRLTHLERGSYPVGPPHPDDTPQEKDKEAVNGWRLSTDSVDSDTRRRAKSSPGPEPSEQLRTRPRGLTVGESGTPKFTDTPPVPPVPAVLSPAPMSPTGAGQSLLMDPGNAQ